MLHHLAALNGKNLRTEDKQNVRNKMLKNTTTGKAAAVLAAKPNYIKIGRKKMKRFTALLVITLTNQQWDQTLQYRISLLRKSTNKTTGGS
jgi:hypothetical protein